MYRETALKLRWICYEILATAICSRRYCRLPLIWLANGAPASKWNDEDGPQLDAGNGLCRLNCVACHVFIAHRETVISVWSPRPAAFRARLSQSLVLMMVAICISSLSLEINLLITLNITFIHYYYYFYYFSVDYLSQQMALVTHTHTHTHVLSVCPVVRLGFYFFSSSLLFHCSMWLD